MIMLKLAQTVPIVRIQQMFKFDRKNSYDYIIELFKIMDV